ncbi:3-oxoacyl-ACP synthase II [Edaphobacter acidisoli]|uniref:Nodulation protein E n=1 Tax=Edaphobacter acidisoli TaxID=2040573 RepID=A0A916W9S5_9BACT|nr:beta-ketoacyl-[acyl-carrier-protein] synthase family protein [Edaphobacter acidisoli]GGA78749.1 3-oxoacyl-ACP synthase II [Edaphobacter acidisoli]
MNRVVVTGLGCVTPIGSTIEDFTLSLFSGTTGIVPIGHVEGAPEGNPGVRFTQMAQVKDFDPLQYMSTGTATATERAAQLGIVAARKAAEHAKLLEPNSPASLSSHLSEDTAIILGCSCAGRSAEEPQLAGLYLRNIRAHPLTVVRTMANSGAAQVSIDLGITGPVLTISTACASGTHAIGQAFHMVRSGLVTAAIAGGHDAPLTFGFLRAWDSMRVVSPIRCRPFSADRDGMTLGEGAAMFTLETLESAQARNATIYAEIVGFGMSADAHHITQPSSDGAAKAIRMALKDARIQPSEVGYINAHGTGTQANDATEAEAIHKALGADIAPTVPVSSTKSLHGHSIGATGAIEALATVLALHDGKAPFTFGTTEVDPTLHLDVITETPRPLDPARPVALSNSLAFGGLNAVLAIRRF